MDSQGLIAWHAKLERADLVNAVRSLGLGQDGRPGPTAWSAVASRAVLIDALERVTRKYPHVVYEPMVCVSCGRPIDAH